MVSNSLQGTGLSPAYYGLSNNSSLLKTLTGETDAAASAAFLNGITNLDSYTADSLAPAGKDTTYSSDVLKKNYNLSNLTNALNTIGSTAAFDTISNLDDYAANLIKLSQSSAFDTVNSTSLSGSEFANTNLMQYVSNAYKSSAILNSATDGTIDIKT